MTTTNLSSKAMLVKLNISMWTARKYDKGASEKVAQDHNSNPDMGRYNKSLLVKGALENLKKIMGSTRTYHYANTLPWDDSGARMLPAKHYLKYGAAMRQFRTEFENELNVFVRNYPDYINDARANLNGLFNPNDYPPPSEIEDKFSMRVHIDPFPESTDFRVSLGDEETERIKQFIEERNRAAIAEANKELWNRLFSSVKNIAEKLDGYGKGEVKKLYESVIGNVAELCDILKTLNVTDDAALEAVRQDVEKKLAGLSVDNLKLDDRQREQAANEAKKILADMKSKFTWGSVANIKQTNDD